MTDLAGNPEDRFSHDAARIIMGLIKTGINSNNNIPNHNHGNKMECVLRVDSDQPRQTASLCVCLICT